jgi:hypothetical protein
MQIAPVAKTGLRIKKSTNKLNPLSLFSRRAQRYRHVTVRSGAQDRQRTQAPMGKTGMPLIRNCVLETMTLSPALSPDEME